jgi:hypothetical protein
MTEDETKAFRQLFLNLWRQVHDLQSGHEALLRTFVESFPSAVEGVQFLDKYEAHKAKFYEDTLLEFEKKFPNLAAELDSNRPLISPDESNKP